MDIKPNHGILARRVEVQIDNEFEWQATMEGLPKPGPWNMMKLPFIQDVTRQMVDALDAGPDYPMYIDMSERRLKKIGRKLMTTERLDMTRDQLLGRMVVATEIAHYLGRSRG